MTSDIKEADLLDRIYAAPLAPDGWVAVIEGLADLVGGGSGWLARHRGGPSAAKPAHVRTPLYSGFMRKAEAHSVLMVDLGERNGVHTAIHISRSTNREGFEEEDQAAVARLLPHLERAAHLSVYAAELTDRAHGSMAALDAVAAGLFLVDGNGTVKHANAAAEAILRARAGVSLRNGRLAAATGALTARLGALIAAAAGDDRANSDGGSMMLTRSGATPLHASVTPLPRDERASAFLEHARVLVSINDPSGTAPAPDAGRRLGEMFGLTAAEQRVALLLLDGLTPQEAAAKLGTRVQTLRNQLRSIFAKTGVHRQSDLVRLLLPLCAQR